MRVIFHRLVSKDLQECLNYYEDQGGPLLADRFFAAVEKVVAQVASNPTQFHFGAPRLRRAALPVFPFHFLYEEDGGKVRFMVLRHDRRRPSFGLRRR